MRQPGAAGNTNPFDTTLVPDTGDIWQQAVVPNAPFSPIILDPGETGRIQLTITPTGPSGTVVRGFVGVDTFDLFTNYGDELEDVAYSYTIK